MKRFTLLLVLLFVSPAVAQNPLGAWGVSPYDSRSLSNPFGAGSVFKTDGLLNPWGTYGSPYSNYSWRNPHATQAPRLYQGGTYRGRLSVNPYGADSTSNRYGRYGSPYSADSINSPYGTGYGRPIYIYPGR